MNLLIGVNKPGLQSRLVWWCQTHCASDGSGDLRKVHSWNWNAIKSTKNKSPKITSSFVMAVKRVTTSTVEVWSHNRSILSNHQENTSTTKYFPKSSQQHCDNTLPFKNPTIISICIFKRWISKLLNGNSDYYTISKPCTIFYKRHTQKCQLI